MWTRLRTHWVAVIVLLQLAVPAVALAMAPSRFGFQMYSGAGWTHIDMEDEAGESHELQLSTYAANPRMEVDWTTLLPEHICRQEPDAVRVTVKRWRSQRTIECP